MGDLNHDGSISDDQVKTEWYPDYGQIENLGEYGRDYKHMYAECSNAGICNRNTGDCECFPGYEGSSCQRRSCPKSTDGAICSSHGVCVPGYKDKQASKNAWELRKFYKCRCDDGYTGYDCSERTCQKGVDPLEVNNMFMNYKFSLPHNHTDVKRALADPNPRPTPNTMVPFYFDIEFDGVKYVSPFISSRDINQICTGTVETVYNKTIALNFQEEIRRALQTLPPISQSSVLLSCNQEEINATDPTHEEDNINKVLVTISVEYTDFDAFKSSILSVHEMYDSIDAGDFHSDNMTDSMPYHTGAEFVTSKEGDPSKTYLEEVVSVATKEYAKEAKSYECSRRGKCNKNTGLCECFYGFYGSACNMQLKLAV